MKRRIKHFFNVIRGSFVIGATFLLFPFARLFLWHKKIWIVSEYGYEARDNGFSFFKYVRINHPEINCFYAIDKNSIDYSKVSRYGNIINFGSFKHYLYFCAAKFHISSKTEGFCPSYFLTMLRKKIHLWGKYVFLQHGVIKDDLTFFYKKSAKLDLFVCGAKPEYDFIKSKFGYSDDELVYSGLPRFDDYHNIKKSNQILAMPTWRRYVNKDNFADSDYYKTWLAFINSKQLNKFLSDNNLILNFYLHPQFKDYVYFFKTDLSNIRILSFEDCDLQELIKVSSIFITDFSSLAFDFGYLKRPVIYYQFDEELFFSGHYNKGYFDYRKDGFGAVCVQLNQVIEELYSCCKNKSINCKYLINHTIFFPLHDNKNSERVYDAILKLE